MRNILSIGLVIVATVIGSTAHANLITWQFEGAVNQATPTPPAAVPVTEPGSLALLGLGLLCTILVRNTRTPRKQLFNS